MTTENLSMTGAASLVDCVRHWAHKQPNDLSYCFLDKGREVDSLTFRELDQQACALAFHLNKQGALGERALLLFPQGLDYLRAFFGCLYGKVVPVTTSPPTGDRRVERFTALADDAEARFVVTSRAALTALGLSAPLPGLERLQWIFLDDIDLNARPAWQAPAIDREDLAFLQYTSGSTASPKGVMLSHGNLVANEAMMQGTFGNSRHSVFVSWLPLYHDMGLIAMVLSALYNGAPCYLMSPEDFVRRPLLWLSAISQYGGTVTAAPDFAYRLCIDRIPKKNMAEIDLGSMQTMLSGAEPIRVSTLERFVEHFQPFGLNPDAMFAGYGLAESSVYVSGEYIREGCTRSFGRAALEANEVIESDRDGLRLVSCGQVGVDSDIRIVDPNTRAELPPARVGEIWVRNPGIGQGYWRRPEQTEATFGGLLNGGSPTEPFLRTGDLGFITDGKLFVCGRIKDLVIVRGRNIYPADVSTAIEDAVDAVKSRPIAVFGVDVDTHEELVVAIALKHVDDQAAQPLIASVRGRCEKHWVSNSAPCCSSATKPLRERRAERYSTSVLRRIFSLTD
ncbi:fatty acyl-AMP ligase [Alkalilimnicola ehrlichii]|uniref:AMP-dependent synthetase/ligase domain-containing protein n=1 Tax=Alkalilimnicola ehrlichii TaxID=351052 RepID=A0A3E0X2Q0_9GAMM|nr:fatty acyl-AMP ligase [Alkalilimnicola ehrlichii]RFA38524.1 hypothetical protein CAL65_04020 [Alkalilimnicola ehrlichii]